MGNNLPWIGYQENMNEIHGCPSDAYMYVHEHMVFVDVFPRCVCETPMIPAARNYETAFLKNESSKMLF